MSEQPQNRSYEYPIQATELRDGADMRFHAQSDHISSYEDGRQLAAAAAEAIQNHEVELTLDQLVGQAAVKVVDLRNKYREDFKLAA